jgi:hypothetical protein
MAKLFISRFLTTYEVNFLKELDENPVATSAELEDAKNFYGDFLRKFHYLGSFSPE